MASFYRDDSRPARWHAIQAKPGHEALTVTNRRRLGVVTPFPQLHQRSLRPRRRRLRIKPIVTGYCFAHFVPGMRLTSVHHTRGVLRIVNSGPFPLPSEDLVTMTIKAPMDGGGFIF